ncbi:hypothetical protein F4779DRAFT_618316 [Xylariaceae sp. FL0662B]|nr:hypothetical protein F4779DRAFT_618316 [Xylariaceae sp. FL0662B]
MQILLSSFILVAVATARPSRIIARQEPAQEESGFEIKVATETNRIIPVVVGGAQDTFVPNSVKAAVGDIVQFQFSNGNHTVTQSAEDSPCQPLQATDPTAIHSGHIPFEDGQTTVGTFNMPVTSTDPMFLYCATGPHCQEGQVMIVNPANDQQVIQYANAAAASGESVDGQAVVGGTASTIPLEAAAFVPAPPQDDPAAAPPAEAPAEAPAATASGADVIVTIPPAGASAVPGTTTVVVTVPASTAAELSATPAV